VSFQYLKKKCTIAVGIQFQSHFFYRVTFEFVEKVRKSFAEADTDNTGYLDVNEFTAFMRRTYPDITNREAQIIFMKV